MEHNLSTREIGTGTHEPEVGSIEGDSGKSNDDDATRIDRSIKREKREFMQKPGRDGEICLSVRGITKRFTTALALSDISFDLAKGDIFGLVGPNGAGKTTLLRILATLLIPDGGKALVCGHGLDDMLKVRAIIGFMPDFLGVYDDMTVREYFQFFAIAYAIPTKLREYAIQETLHTVGLDRMSDMIVEGLSRGMKQRLSLGRAIIHSPRILLLDEPASGLDPLARLELREILRGLAAKGTSIIISSHVLEDLADVCDRIGVINNGCLLCSEATAELIEKRGGSQIRLMTRGKNDELYEVLECREDVEGLRWDGDMLVFRLKKNDGMDIAALVKSLIERGFPLVSFFEEKPTLETAYLTITRASV
jgi:ABC-2 type transport system ATP-binding protein